MTKRPSGISSSPKGIGEGRSDLWVCFLPSSRDCSTLPCASLNSSSVAESGPLPGSARCIRANCEEPIGSACAIFKSPILMSKSLICGEIGRIIVPLLHAPAVVFFDQVQIGRALDMKGGHVVDLEIWQQFLAEFAPGSVPGFLDCDCAAPSRPRPEQPGPPKEGSIVCDSFCGSSFAFHHGQDNARSRPPAPAWRRCWPLWSRIPARRCPWPISCATISVPCWRRPPFFGSSPFPSAVRARG